MTGNALKCLLSDACRKKEEPNQQILLEVSKSAQWSEPAAVGLEISHVEITTEAENCIKFIQM